MDNWEIDNHDFQKIRDLIVAYSALEILSIANQYILFFAYNISYIAPMRAIAQRYYRSQDFAVREVDAQGEDLAMFINSLNTEKKEKFQEWLQKYFNFSVDIHKSEGHISLKLKEKQSQREHNLTDTGFGFSQVLPILTQLWWLSRREYKFFSLITFAIEQPELHLHPKLQAEVVDAFIGTIKLAKEQGIDLRLIIETHSDTVINRIGQRIAHKDIDNKDVNVVIFERDKVTQPAKIRIARYGKAGILANWPMGFFLPDDII